MHLNPLTKILAKLVLVVTLVLLLSPNSYSQRKGKKDVGMERLNDNYGGDADTSLEGYEPLRFNGKLQFLVDPFSMAINGRVYGELQYSMKEDFLICVGLGYHGLKKDQMHPVINETDSRTGLLFRLGIYEHGYSVLYHRIDFAMSSCNYLSYSERYDGFGQTDLLEYEISAFKAGAFYSLGMHIPIAEVFFVDAFLGVGFMLGEPKSYLKNVYTNSSKTPPAPKEFLGNGIGYFSLDGPATHAGLRVGYVLVK